MMRLKIAIVEDDEMAVKRLRVYLERWRDENHKQWELAATVFDRGESLIKKSGRIRPVNRRFKSFLWIFN